MTTRHVQGIISKMGDNAVISVTSYNGFTEADLMVLADAIANVQGILKYTKYRISMQLDE